MFNPSRGQLPDANAVARGLSNMTNLPQKAILHQIVDSSGLYENTQSNQLSSDKLMRFLTQPRMIEFYRSMADEQVQAVIRGKEILAVISPLTETHVRLMQVMFKEINLVGMDQVDALSPASIQTYNEFKKAVSVMPFKKQAKVNVKTLIRQLAGYDRDMDNANEVEREVLGLVGQLFTEMVKNVLDGIVASILPYGYKVLGNPRVTPFVAIAEAIDATFMAGQTSPELAMAMLAKRAQGLGVDSVNIMTAAGMLDFWRTNMLPGRAVDFLRGYYDPESGIEYRVIAKEDIGNGQILSRGVIRSGNLTIDLWEAPIPKVNSNDAGYDRMHATRTVMGQFFTFPQNSEGLLIAGPNAEKTNNTVDVFTIDGNSGRNVVYSLIEGLKFADVFAPNGTDAHETLVTTIDAMNANNTLRLDGEMAVSGSPRGAFTQGDKVNSKNYRAAPALVRFNKNTGKFEFAKRLGDANELTSAKLSQIAAQLVAHADTCGKGGNIADHLDTVVEYLQDSVHTEVTGEFLTALIVANQVRTATGPWVLNDYGFLNLPLDVTVPASGLPPLFHSVGGIKTLARERNGTTMWKEAGKRAHKTLQSLRAVTDGLMYVTDRNRDDMLQLILELVYAIEYKTRYPDGVFLRANSSVVAAAAGNGNAAASGYQTVSSVLNTYVSTLNGATPAYDDVITALEALAYTAPEVEILRRLEDGPKRRLYSIALLDIANPVDDNRTRRKKAESIISKLNDAVVENFNKRDGDDKKQNKETIDKYVNGKVFEEGVLTPYSKSVRSVINVPTTQNDEYPLPETPASNVSISASDIKTYNDLLPVAKAGNLDENDVAFTAITNEYLQNILIRVNTDAVRGQRIPGSAIQTNFILSPLVSTTLLENYAKAAGSNALALPAYEGINEMSISEPIANTAFKHNIRFAGKHLRSHFALDTAAPFAARNNAMDIDAEYNMIVAGRGFGALNPILGSEDTENLEKRLEMLVASTASTAERVMASVIVGLPNTMATHERLSKFGARLINVALLRPFETNVLSLISMSGINGFTTMASPTEFNSENHSQVSTMIMTMAKEIGTNVIDGRRVSGICGFTSHRVVGGYSKDFVRPGDLEKEVPERPSVIAIAYPDTVEYSLGNYLSLFNNLPIRYAGDIRIDSKCKHPAAEHLKKRFPDLAELVKEAEDSAVDINTNVHVATILSRGLTRHYNPLSGRYETIRSGVSAKSKIVLNSPGAEGLMNGGIRTMVTTDSDFATTRMGFH